MPASASPVLAQARLLALDLHRVLREMDAARWRRLEAEVRAGKVDGTQHEIRNRITNRLSDIRARAAQLLDGSFQARAALRARLSSVVEALHEWEPVPSESWTERRAQLSGAYEGLANALREYAVHVPALRPTNYKRNLFHVGGASLGLATILALPEQITAIALGFALLGWSMELSRRLHPRINAFYFLFFSHVAHPHERYRVNSATWFVTALAFISVLVEPAAGAVAVITLGLGDPSAALIGRRFGRHRLLNGRSVEGTTTFLIVSFIGSLVALLLGFPELPLGASASMAIGGALLGAAAELISRRVDDNLTIPVCAAAGAALMAMPFT